MVVLSGDQAVRDLLEKRSNIYSDRPDMYIGQKICSGGNRMLMMVSPAIPTYKCLDLTACVALRTDMEKGTTKFPATLPIESSKSDYKNTDP